MTVRLVSQGEPGMQTHMGELTEHQVAGFARDGYVIVRGLAEPGLVEELRAATLRDLELAVPPVELEADVRYPGAPTSRADAGGTTIRRLLQAHGRSPAVTQWISSPAVRNRLKQLLGPAVVMPLAHHNCIMTKQPSFSSDTGWHQDIRYWSFQRPELVSLWLALGEENRQNGCLQLLPGTHISAVEPWRLDEAKFLRTDVDANHAWLQSRIFAELRPGDALFFHCRTFHAASRNHTSEVKLSLVLTFRPGDNTPIPGSRSAALPELMLPD